MGTPSAAQVVVVPFPFSDLSGSKLRPAILLAPGGRGDWILCQITSNPYSDTSSVPIRGQDFVEGELAKLSYARPNKLFTANSELILETMGTLKKETVERIVNTLKMNLQSSIESL